MKRILIYLVLVNACINAFPQNNNDNMLKYWHYRNRLKYFVLPGTNQGESELIRVRNAKIESPSVLLPDTNQKYCKNGDQTIEFGFYIGMLATEYKLLSDNGRVEEAANTLHELDLALYQFDNWLDKCEYYYNGIPTIDGYFVRDNVPVDFLDTVTSNGYTVSGEKHLDLLNKNLTLNNNHWNNSSQSFGIGVPRGHPGYIDYIDAGPYFRKDSMSQDMAIGLLKGLSLVKKFCPTSQSQWSENIACNVITYIQNSNLDHGLSPWCIYTPLGDLCSDQIGVLANSYGFVQALKFFNNSCVNEDITSTGMNPAWQAQAFFASNKDYNSHMAATLAAIGKSWRIRFVLMLGIYPILYHYISFDIPATGWGIKLQTQRWGTETFYLLLYEALQHKTTNYLTQEDVVEQINSAPCEGPYDYQYLYPQYAGIHAPGGWANTNRFHSEKWEQNGTVINPDGGTNKISFGNFPGLDYMLLYNLNYIINGGIPYENYNDRYLSGTVSSDIRYVAFDSITSTQIINPTQPLVEYKAGEQIKLNPGFHATSGSDFHAYIGKTECGENFITDSIVQPSTFETTSEDTCITDSLPVMPCGYDTLHFNGFDGDTTNQYIYSWTFQGGIPSQSTIKNPSVYYPTPGTYNIFVELTDTSTGLQTGRLCMIIVKPACNDSSGGKKLFNRSNNYPLSNYEIKVFPNPTTGTFNVACSDNNLQFTIEVSDVIGNILYYVKNAKGNVPFDLSLKPKGIYFVKVNTSDGKIYYRKIIHN